MLANDVESQQDNIVTYSTNYQKNMNRSLTELFPTDHNLVVISQLD